MRRLAVACACVAVALTAAAPVHAKTERFALIIANHEGGSGLQKLRYAGRDGARFADVLAELGGFSRADMLSVVDGDSAAVLSTMDEVERQIADKKRAGDEVIFLLYYSGHAQNGLLRLGNTSLDMQVLKKRLEASAADVRLAFIDSCGAGAITREKGGSLAPPFVVAVDEGLSAKGQVIITSSSADEVSQESDDIQGSFFTHYLATGLRGDADRNGDGRVTLDEAYTYAYGRTVAATATTRSGAQHPTYSYDLRGAGDVVLSEPGGAELLIDFPQDLEGKFFVVDLDRQLFVAEVQKSPGAASRIALPAGQYAIKKRLDDHLLMQRLGGRDKGALKGIVTVDEKNMEQVSFADDYAKGTPILSDEIEQKIGWSVSVGVGGHVVLDTVDHGNLFPATPLLVLEARAHNLLRSHLLLSVDAAYGNVSTRRILDDPAFGHLEIPFTHHLTEAGASLLWEEKLFDDTLLLAGGGRVGMLSFLADFPTAAGPYDDQFDIVFTPGVVGLIGWNATTWAHAEVLVRAHYLPYTIDGELRHLAVTEAVASAWIDF